MSGHVTMTDEPDQSCRASDTELHEQLQVVLPKSRQEVMHALGEMDANNISIDCLTDEILARTDETTIRSNRRRIVRTRLHHIDLPAFDDAGILEYDPETNRVLHVDRNCLRHLRNRAAEWGRNEG